MNAPHVREPYASFEARRRYAGRAVETVRALALPELITAAFLASEPFAAQLPAQPEADDAGGLAQWHASAMALALWEAAFAFAEDEVPVGAVLLHRNGRLLGRGRNLREQTRDPTDHAEIVAMRLASHALQHWRLEECTLVVTLEPCPMCAGAAVNARLGSLVYGTDDPKAGACGSVVELCANPRLNHRFPVHAGTAESACAEMLREYFRRKRSTKSPSSESKSD